MESNSDMRDESGKAGSAILRVLIKLLLGAAAAVSLCAIVVLVLQISGKNSLYSRADSGEMLHALSEMTVKQGGDSGGGSEEDEEWMDGDIRYQGIHYRYNEDVVCGR
ncbi:MAG: hypothetical protein HFH91_06970 [Lachnospiraceae bacterium]|nr:hypothetical protein [Lachnospiraceae bacterium]